MSSVPCEKDEKLRELIVQYADVLKEQAHTLGSHGLSEIDFYQGGLFRGAIERIRGQFAATMGEKRDFAKRVLNWLQDNGHIREWDSAEESTRHDYVVRLNSGRLAGIELKGCLDGNNTNIFERPAHVSEFVIWSVCTNAGADPRHNVWSGIHTRLSAEVISRKQQVDGLLVWDWLCGTVARSCPKVAQGDPVTTIGPYCLPPPCIWLFPGSIPEPETNPTPAVRTIHEVEILRVFHVAFGGSDGFVNQVKWGVEQVGDERVRTTAISRGGRIVAESKPTPIQRA